MIKKKECSFEGCTFPRWSKYFCKVHDFLEEGEKTSALKKQTFIKKKRKSQEEIDEQIEQYEKDWSFYNEIWKERPHFCTNCDRPLGKEPKSTFFDHILEKGKYPEFRYERWNIRLLDGDCHQLRINNKDSEKMKIQEKIIRDKYLKP